MSITVMTLLSALLTLIFLGVLAYALIRLDPVLASIGGTPTSYLAKLRFGLRAIERETSHLPGQASRINRAARCRGGRSERGRRSSRADRSRAEDTGAIAWTKACRLPCR